MGGVKRLAVARLWHEGNSFSPVATTLADFQRHEWASGEQAAAFYRGSPTELGAAVDFAARRGDWQVTFLRSAGAPPGGPASDEAFETIRADILSGLRAGEWDAVYLSLHGALATPGRPAADLDLLADVRAAVGETPIAVSLDLHANVGPPLVELADIAIGYKTYPHTDMFETAAVALDLLARTVEGSVRPMALLAKAGAILPSFNMRTGDGPMAEIWNKARKMRAHPDAKILDISLFGGFAYGDSPHAGAAALVTTDGLMHVAGSLAVALADEIWQRRERFMVSLPPAPEGIARALAAPAGTVAVLDPADNPLSGGIGDTPGLFRALLEARPAVPAAFAFFCDPDLVAQAHERGAGARLRCRLGGRLTDAFGKPVEVEAIVERLTDGRFRNTGPMWTGMEVDLGRTALLSVDGIRVIVTERCQSPNDPAYFALHGIDLAATRLLCVKAKNHFRAAFAPLCRTIIETEAPGPAPANLTALPFRHAPRALFPLSEGSGPALVAGPRRAP